MVDDRTYIKVHDGIEDHPKIIVLSDKAFRVLVTTWAWSSRHTTDGFIPDAVWNKRANPKVRKELDGGLVHRPGHGCPKCPPVPDGHVRMHDYLEHQRSAEKIDELKEQKKRAGRLGNHKRWHVEQGVTDPSCEFCAIADGSQDRSQVRSGVDGDFGNESNLRNANETRSDVSQVRAAGRDSGPVTATQKTSTREDPISRSSHVRSQKRSQTGRKTSPETETETDKEEPITSGGKPAVGRGARKPTAEELAATAHSPQAHKLVQAYAQTCTRRPPRTVLTDLAHQVDALLAEDWPADAIAEALTAWGAKGLNAKLLPSVAHEITNKARVPPPASGYRSATDAAIEDFLNRGTRTPNLPAIEGSAT
jgi:hypothetical protein